MEGHAPSLAVCCSAVSGSICRILMNVSNTATATPMRVWTPSHASGGEALGILQQHLGA